MDEGTGILTGLPSVKGKPVHVALEGNAIAAKTTKMTDAERAAGSSRRADFHVYYRRNGKLLFDAMWAATAEEATAKMLDFARELRWKIEIVRVDPINPHSPDEVAILSAPSQDSSIRFSMLS